MLMKHRQQIMADRAADTRLTVMAQIGNAPNSDLPFRILKIDLDGMDQAKFRVPRNTASSKAADDKWRPELHLTGVIAYGICELYFAADCDMRKDSNTQQTILANTLDYVENVLAGRGMTVPRHIVFRAARRQVKTVMLLFDLPKSVLHLSCA